MTSITDPHPIVRNIEAVAELERDAILRRTPLERLTDAITRTAGSVSFIVIHVLIFSAWFWINAAGSRPLDPYPFPLLNLLVSLEAITLTSFVLMTQDRMTRQADKRAHLDLQVNVLAEQELTTMLHMLHALCQQAGVGVSVRDERVSALLKDTDIHKLSVAIDSALYSAAPK